MRATASSSSDRTAPSGTTAAAVAGWTALALGVAALVAWGAMLGTGWSPFATDDASLERDLRRAWLLMGGHAGGVTPGELTDDPARLERARTILDDALARAPRNPRAHLYSGLHHLAAGDLDRAREAVDKSRDLDPSSVQTHLVLGVLHTRAKDYAAAEAVLRDAVELDPDSVSAWNNLGQLLWIMGREEESLEAYREKLAAEKRLGISPGATPRASSLD